MARIDTTVDNRDNNILVPRRDVPGFGCIDVKVLPGASPGAVAVSVRKGSRMMEASLKPAEVARSVESCNLYIRSYTSYPGLRTQVRGLVIGEVSDEEEFGSCDKVGDTRARLRHGASHGDA